MDKRVLIDHSSQDLAGERSAVIQHISYAAKATERILTDWSL